MIQELIQKVLLQEGALWLQKIELGPDRQTEILDITCDAIVDEMRDTLVSGKGEEITMAFTGGSTSHMVQRCIKRCSLDLLFNLGLGAGMADTISTSLVPMVFDTLATDKSVPEGTFTDVDMMIRDLKPEGTQDQLGDMLGGMFGLR